VAGALGPSLGQAAGDPLLDVAVAEGDPAPPDGHELWVLREVVATADGAAEAEQRLWRQRDGTFLLRTNRGGGLSVDPTGRAVTVTGPDTGTCAQLVAAIGLPLLLHGAECVVLHGAAAALDGRAVVIAGRSGRGKSSSLTRLVDEGWAPITEDLCTIDLRGAPVLWPGPPWLRRLRGEPGPQGSTVRFETLDKTVWDIADRQSTTALPIGHLVVVDEPGGDAAAVTALATGEAVAALADHAVWLAEAEAAPAALFSPLARLATEVPVSRLRLPRRDSWLDGVPELLGALTGAA
jgi:hypothetical protein